MWFTEMYTGQINYAVLFVKNPTVLNTGMGLKNL